MYKSIILAVSALAGFGYAQSVPVCAQACVVPPATCGLADIACICNDSEWIASVACCVFASCPDQADRTQALDYGNTICNPVGATLPTTTSSCPASTGSSTATGAAASSAASASSVLSSVSSASASSASISSALSSALSSVSTTASGGASTSSALATRVAVADGVGIVGALLGVAALL